MTRKLIPLWTSLCAMLLLMSARPVHAQAVLWVASNGNDSNVCSQASPCLTFQGAVNKGNVAQINCLTSGDYGPVFIQASITIDCGTGNIGIIENGDATAVIINTAVPATIVLRHLSMNGLGSPNNGFQGISALIPSGTLVVEDCTIQGYANSDGIQFLPFGGRGLLQVSNTQIVNNAGGIVVRPGSGQIASVTLSGVAMVANSSVGLVLTGTGIVAGTMRDSIVGENAYGVYVDATQAFFTIEESSVIANVTAGIHTQSAGAVLNVGASTIGANAVGVDPQAGSIISFGNNQFSANAADGNFTGTKALK
jgi:hypothetical protein